MAFSGCPRGYRDNTEAECFVGTVRLQALGILTLEPERLKIYKGECQEKYFSLDRK